MEELEEIKNAMSYCPDSGFIYWEIETKNQKKKGDRAGGLRKDGYTAIEFKGKAYFAHRIAWFLYYNQEPMGQIDHINGFRSDNRIVNLRVLTPRGNSSNRKEHRNGRLIGACFDKESGKYLSSIYCNRIIYLGRYPTEQEAHNMYLKALRHIDEAKEMSNSEFRKHLIKLYGKA